MKSSFIIPSISFLCRCTVLLLLPLPHTLFQTQTWQKLCLCSWYFTTLCPVGHLLKGNPMSILAQLTKEIWQELTMPFWNVALQSCSTIFGTLLGHFFQSKIQLATEKQAYLYSFQWKNGMYFTNLFTLFYNICEGGRFFMSALVSANVMSHPLISSTLV